MKDNIFSWFLAAVYFAILFIVLKFAFRGTLHILTDLLSIACLVVALIVSVALAEFTVKRIKQ